LAQHHIAADSQGSAARQLEVLFALAAAEFTIRTQERSFS